MNRNLLLAATVITGLALMVSGCNPQVDSSVATFNANATRLASGGQVIGTFVVTPLPPTITPTPIANSFDLTQDQTALLVTAWGKIYGLPSGSPFEIIATSGQVTKFVIDYLQVQGLSDTVKGGNVALGQGQFRLDLALVDTLGANGAGTVTFQPTLDAQAAFKLNPQGSEFGSLTLPPGLIPSLGDAVHTTLMGANTDTLSKVTLTGLSLEDSVLHVTGKVK